MRADSGESALPEAKGRRVILKLEKGKVGYCEPSIMR